MHENRGGRLPQTAAMRDTICPAFKRVRQSSYRISNWRTRRNHSRETLVEESIRMNGNIPSPSEPERRGVNTSVKVHVYGFLPMTRKAYLITQVTLFAVMVLILLGVKPVLSSIQVLAFVYDHFVAFLLVIALLELGETLFMLRRFKAKQQEAVPPSEPESDS